MRGIDHDAFRVAVHSVLQAAAGVESVDLAAQDEGEALPGNVKGPVRERAKSWRGIAVTLSRVAR